jgi:hypothetical protein
MEHTTKIDLKQREHLVALIHEAKRSEREELKNEKGANEQSVAQEVIESKGFSVLLKKARALYDQILPLQKEVDAIERKFREAGFERGEDDTLVLRSYGGSTATHRLIEKRLKSILRPIDKALTKYDLAEARIWSASTAQELDKIVGQVISDAK